MEIILDFVGAIATKILQSINIFLCQSYYASTSGLFEKFNNNIQNIKNKTDVFICMIHKLCIENKKTLEHFSFSYSCRLFFSKKKSETFKKKKKISNLR